MGAVGPKGVSLYTIYFDDNLVSGPACAPQGCSMIRRMADSGYQAQSIPRIDALHCARNGRLDHRNGARMVCRTPTANTPDWAA